MSVTHTSAVERFALAASKFCAWATSPVVQGENDAELAVECLSSLFAAGCALGWKESEPADFRRPDHGTEAVRLKATALPFQYYSEVFNNLVTPPEQPVVGDLVDDLVDIYSDIAPGLVMFEKGDLDAAENHWRFWLAIHWGEHATSALRALWSYLSGRKGSSK